MNRLGRFRAQDLQFALQVPMARFVDFPLTFELLDQLDLVARVVRPARVGVVQRCAAAGAAIRCVGVLGIDRQFLGAAMPRRTLGPARLPRLGRALARLRWRILLTFPLRGGQWHSLKKQPHSVKEPQIAS